ncbi:hypothetical protein ABZ567_31170 [Streptomyces sp. NPDC016459]
MIRPPVGQVDLRAARISSGSSMIEISSPAMRRHMDSGDRPEMRA